MATNITSLANSNTRQSTTMT